MQRNILNKQDPNNPENEISHRVKLLILCEKVVTVHTRPDATEEEIIEASKEKVDGTILNAYAIDIEDAEII